MVEKKVLIDWMEGYTRKKKFNGCSLLVLNDQKIIFDLSAGFLDAENTLSFENNSIVRIFSMTKAIVSASLLALLEKKNISTKAPISIFIPKFEKCYALVKNAKTCSDVIRVATPSIAQLLNHTSGLSYFFNEDLIAQEYAAQNITFAPNNFSLDKMVEKLSEIPLVSDPGSKWSYSVGVDVAGKILEIISGQSLDLFLEEFILDPLGMKDTSFYLPVEKKQRLSSCFFFDNMSDNFKPLKQSYEGFSYDKKEVTNFSGGSGLLSTALDYSKFAYLLLNDGIIKDKRFFSKKVMKKIKSNSLSGDIASIGQKSFAQMTTLGMGHSLAGSVIIQSNKGFPSHIGDFGWGGMGSNYFWIDYEKKTATIFMTQLVPSSAYPNRCELKGILTQ